MNAGLLPHFDRLRRQGGFRQSGHQHPAAEPRGLGQLHQRRRAGLARNFRLHPPPSRAAVRPVLLRRRDAARRRLLEHRRPPAATAVLAVQPQTAGHRAAAAGRAVLGLPGRAGHPFDVLRPALRLSAQPVEARPPPLPGGHGHAGHAGHLRHLSALCAKTARPKPPTRPAASGRGLSFEDETAKARLDRPRKHPAQRAAAGRHRLRSCIATGRPTPR